jgi:AraC family transcriptional regulator
VEDVQIRKSSYSIVNEKSNCFYWKGTGALSIKSFYNGRAHYNTGQGNYLANEENFLILNDGQEYSITIESDKPVESFCIFFPDDWTRDVYRNLVLTEEVLLEDPSKLDVPSVEFVEKTYYRDNLITPIMNNIRLSSMSKNVGRLWIESQIYTLLQRMIVLHKQLLLQVESLSGLRFSTRKEIFRRVSIGHDYMNAFYMKNIYLEDIAKAAMLSPNHFLRSYKQIMRVTPNQFLAEKRLQTAKHLLINTSKPITQICFDVGFQSISNFSLFFSRRFACAPSQMRKK